MKHRNGVRLSGVVDPNPNRPMRPVEFRRSCRALNGIVYNLT